MRAQLDLTELLEQLRADGTDITEIRIGDAVYRRDGEAPVDISTGPEGIVAMVSDLYRLAPDEIRSRTKVARVVWPRQVAMYLMRELLGMSSSECAAAVGLIDHTSALAAFRRVEQAMRTDPQRRAEVIWLTGRIRSDHEPEGAA